MKIKLIPSSLLLLLLLTQAVSKAFAEESDLYNFLWLDPDKKVFVLQNKQFKKRHTTYADVGYLFGISSPFQSVSGVAFKAGFYFSETFALEFFYNQYSSSDNTAFKAVESVNNTVPFVRRINNVYGGALIWSPFYGKINTFNEIFYFDWSFALGYGKIGAESNAQTVGETDAPNTYDEEIYGGVLINTALRFHINTMIHVGLSAINTFYYAYGPDRSKGELMSSNMDFMFSTGISY